MTPHYLQINSVEVLSDTHERSYQDHRLMLLNETRRLVSEKKNDSVIPAALAPVIGGQPDNKNISDIEQEKGEMESPSSTDAEKNKID